VDCIETGQDMTNGGSFGQSNKTAGSITVVEFTNSYRSVGIELGYGLDDRSSRVRFQAEARNLSLYHRFQTGSGAHSASLSNGY
jgi:hypothetical protein